MFCKQCGVENPDDVKVCVKCGADPYKQKTPTVPSPATVATSAGPAAPGGISDGATVETMIAPGVDGESRYERIEEVGRGGMGIVFKARDRTLGRLIALKQLKVDDPKPSNMQRILMEAKILARLRHFNICQIHDIGWSGQGWYIAMEYIEGGSLSQRIAKQGPLSVKETLAIVRPLVDALHHAHKEGVIHRDIKPQNILFRNGNEPILTDFGVAKVGELDLTATGTGMGSPFFMSPEQATDAKHVDARSDIYSLGATIYTMVTNKYPVPLDPALVPPVLRGIVVKCLKEDPAQRFQNCAELADALRIAEREAGPWTGPLGLSGRQLAIVGGCAASVLVAVVAGMLAWRASRPVPVTPIEPVAGHSIQHAGSGDVGVALPQPTTSQVAVAAGPRGALLKLQTTPDADVIAAPLDGGRVERLGRADATGRLDATIPTGAYDLVIQKPDCEPVTNRITAIPDQVIQVQRDLRPMPAKLLVRSQSPAEIWEGSIRIGKTGELITNVGPGVHRLVLKRRGFLPLEMVKTVAANEYLEVDAPAMSPLVGLLVVSSTMDLRYGGYSDQLPREAEIKIGSEPWRKVSLPYTNNSLPIAESYPVELRMSGYEVPDSRTVKIVEDGETTLVFTVSPKPAVIRIVSDLPNAGVYRKGTEVGKVNSDIALEPFRRHELEIRADNHQSRSISLPVMHPGESYSSESISLRRMTAQLVIAAENPAAAGSRTKAGILVDGKDLGEHELPYTVDSLSVGEHTVDLKAAAWQTGGPQQITLDPEKANKVRFVLKPAMCMLTFQVEPAGAVISVDGKPVASDTLEVEPGRNHQITAQMKGYLSYSSKVYAESGKTITVKVQLEKGGGRQSLD